MNFKFKEGDKVKIINTFSEYDEFIGTIECKFRNNITNSNKYSLIIGETILREVFDERNLIKYNEEV